MEKVSVVRAPDSFFKKIITQVSDIKLLIAQHPFQRQLSGINSLPATPIRARLPHA